MSEWVPYSTLDPAAGYARVYHKITSEDEGNGIYVTNTEGSWKWEALGGGGYRFSVHMFDDANPNTTSHALWVNTTGYLPKYPAVDVSGQSYIVVQDLHLVCSGSGLFMNDADHITVADCRLSGSARGVYGVKVGASPDVIAITDNDIRYIGDGIKFRDATNVTVTGNKVYNTLVKHAGEDAEGVGLNNCQNSEVAHNEFTDIPSTAISFYSKPSGVVSDVYIHHNYVFGSVDKGILLGRNDPAEG